MDAVGKIREITRFLKKFGIDSANKDAELIISNCLGIDRVTIYRDNPLIAEEYILRIDGFVKRRSKREPLQYILGETEFYGLKINVGPGVFIPRPETELLVEEAIKKVTSEGKGSSLSILDLCTGSGCVALALARKFPDAQVYGIDASEIAIEYARKNAETNGINNVTFLRGNLFEPIASATTFDLIVSNPPYIRRADIKNLQPEIKNWEPIEALDGGKDGLDYYRAIIPQAKGYLKRGGYLILEIGVKQPDKLKKMAQNAGFMKISLTKDYTGVERIFIATLGR